MKQQVGKHSTMLRRITSSPFSSLSYHQSARPNSSRHMRQRQSWKRRLCRWNVLLQVWLVRNLCRTLQRWQWWWEPAHPTSNSYFTTTFSSRTDTSTSTSHSTRGKEYGHHNTLLGLFRRFLWLLFYSYWPW